MDLAQVVLESGARSVAIVGTAKNVGKTVTLNYLVRELSVRGYGLAVLSSGRDGERVDALTGEPKPQVYLPRGSWVATAEAFLTSATFSLEVVDVWERAGVFGRLVLGRVVEPGFAELTGPRSARQLASAIKKFLAYGADIVLVDGALDRKAAASPGVTDACIFATGASSTDDLEAVAATVESLVWVWSLPAPEDREVAELARGALDRARVCIIKRPRGKQNGRREDAGGLLLVPTGYPTALNYEDRIAGLIDGESLALVVPGSADRVLLREISAFLARPRPGKDGGPSSQDRAFYLIMRDPSCAMFGRQHGLAFERYGGRIRVVEPGRVLAVTVNPCCSGGSGLDPGFLVRYLGEKLRPVPVFDVVSGEAFREEVA